MRLVCRPTLAQRVLAGLPGPVVDAPSPIEMLPAEARMFLEEFQSRMLLPLEVAVVIQEVRWEPGCHNDPRLLRSARSCARLVRQTMKIGLTALTRRRRRRIAFGSSLTAAKQTLWSCCLEMACRVSMSASGRAHECLLACTTGALTLLTVSTGCVSLERVAIFFCWSGVSRPTRLCGRCAVRC